MHCSEPGEHVPPHIPVAASQTFVHAGPAVHVPVPSHVCGVRPLHWWVPGVQLPVQPPGAGLVVQMY
jgi:hypothetical protein